MEQKSHILITRYAEKCIKNGLYGVTKEKINLISNININDQVYIYDITKKEINGPFIVKKDLFFDNETKVWESKKKSDDYDPKVRESKKSDDSALYPYRIYFNYDKNYYTEDSSILWTLYWNNILLPITTSNKSVITLFPEDSKHLFKIISNEKNMKNEKISDSSSFESKIKKVELKLTFEADLEYYILKNQEWFFEFLSKSFNLNLNSKAILYNQVTLPVHNFTMDLFIANDINDTTENLVIIELKKEEINKNTIDQLRLYGKYFRDYKKTLIAIGSEFFEEDCKEIVQLKYKFSNNELLLIPQKRKK